MQPSFGDRSLFPDLASRIYLNHAAISPASTPVQRAAHDVITSVATQGMQSFMQWLDQREALREDLARTFGGAAVDYGFVANTTAGVMHIAWSLDWRPGDEVLLFDGEFPANRLPWQQAAAHFDVGVRTLPLTGFGDGSGLGLARVEEALKSGSLRLVAVSMVQFNTGLAMPLSDLGALCRRYGALLFVDAIQGAGVVPFDVDASGIDFMSVGSHKWLMGLEGCAFLFARPSAMKHIRPRTVGWLSPQDGLGFLSRGAGHLKYDRPYKTTPAVFEGGAYNSVGFHALHVSLGMLNELGIPAIFEHVQAWHDAVERGLLERGFTSLRPADPAARSGTLALRPPGWIEGPALVSALDEVGIATTLPDGNWRLAPHWPNALTEGAALLEAIDALRTPFVS